MSRVIVGTTMSLDGFINDRNGDLAPLYPDMAQLMETESLKESIRDTGAVVMGRRTFDLGLGDLTDYEYQVPIFVLTHNPPTEVTEGQNENLTITFVTDGIESAMEKAKAAAGGKDVTIVGGASTAQQCLKAGFADELHIGIFPILLGEGLRFFEPSSTSEIGLEKIEVMESPTRTDIKYRVVHKNSTNSSSAL